jgi:hypothetical protein
MRDRRRKFWGAHALQRRWIEQSLARCQIQAAKPHIFSIARGAADPPKAIFVRMRIAM